MNFSGNRRECNTCRGRDYYARNVEKVKASVRVYAAKNKEMLAQKQREHHRKNPHLKREAALKRNYGITLNDYEALVGANEGKCWICHTKPRGQLHVDHCHDTGQIRGALCHQCNIGIGMFKNSPETLEAAITYLRAPHVVVVCTRGSSPCDVQDASQGTATLSEDGRTKGTAEH